MYIFIFLVISVVGSLAFFYVMIYNDLEFYNKRIEIAEISIKDNLNKKMNEILSTNENIKKIFTNKDYLKDYCNIKIEKISVYELDRKLSDCVTLINDLKYDNKKLHNKAIETNLENLYSIDKDLASSKNFYNKHTAILNSKIRKVPNNLIAKFSNFKIKPFYDKKNMQELNEEF